MRVDGRAFRAVGERRIGLRVADLRVDEILPEVHAGAMAALAIGHPGRHLRHAAHVHTVPAEGGLDERLGGGNARARLAREEKEADAERARIDALAPRRLREVQRIGRRAVERARPQIARPLHGGQGLAGGAGAEGEDGGAQPLRPHQGAPGAEVQAEEGAYEDGIAGPEARPPEHPRMRLADALPVVGADAEHGGPAGGAAGPVNARHRLRLDAEIVAEGRMRGLRRAQVRLLDDGEAREVVEALQRVGRDTGGLPAPPVERAALPGPAQLLAQLVQDVAVALRGLGALELRPPVLGVRGGSIGRVVARRPARQWR